MNTHVYYTYCKNTNCGKKIYSPELQGTFKCDKCGSIRLNPVDVKKEFNSQGIGLKKIVSNSNSKNKKIHTKRSEEKLLCNNCSTKFSKNAKFCKKCGTKRYEDRIVKYKICSICQKTYSIDYDGTFCEIDGGKLDEKQKVLSEKDFFNNINDTNSELKGIGGWLILVAIHLFLSFLIIAYSLITTNELSVFIILCIHGFTIYSFITKKVYFKHLFLALSITYLLYNIALMGSNDLYIDEYNLHKKGTIRSSISSLIWITYMYVSERVKNTFVNE